MHLMGGFAALDERSTHQASLTQDEVGQLAWNWLVRQFETEEGLDDATHEALLTWLGEDPRHLAAYQEAMEIWTAAACLKDDRTI